jgi:hypothetical protein
MKTRTFQKSPLTIVALTVLALVAGNVVAQDSPTSATTSASTVAPAAASPTAPQLSYGVPEILQLSQAKVGDSTIIAYIQKSGNNYGLTAAQIIYLRQQGVSDAVVNAMLNQRSQTAQSAPTDNATVSQPAAPTAPVQNNPDTSQTTTVAAQPSVSYVPATTSSTVYVVPNTQTYYYYSSPYPYYYPYYYGWPAVSLSFGWGGYYYGGYRGGYYGGYHGGYYGGWHGGGGGGWHGGSSGWHGGGGGGWHH